MSNEMEIETQDGVIMKCLCVTKARAKFREILSDTAKTVIMRHGKPTKVLIDYEEFQKMRQDRGAS